MHFSRLENVMLEPAIPRRRYLFTFLRPTQGRCSHATHRFFNSHDMKYFSLSFLLLFVASLNAQTFSWSQKGSSASVNATELAAYERAYNEVQIGQANVYPAVANGTTTAFGEVYRPTEVTAGHALLPMGTLLRVINPNNQTAVVVRVNDRPRDCDDCLVTLSQTAARTIGLDYGGRVSVERTGFSNWNPAPPQTSPAPAAYGNVSYAPTAYTPQPATYGSSYPAAGSAYDQSGTVRPAQIDGRPYEWSAKGETTRPSTYADGRVTPRTRPVVVTTGNVPTVVRPAPQSTPSVMDREVVRAPAAYGSAPAPATYGATARGGYSEPVPYRGDYYEADYQTTPARQVTPRQAAPPAPTVPYYQTGRTVAAPTAYQAAPAPLPAPQASTRRGPAIQLGAFANEMYAQNRINELRAMGIPNVFYVQTTKADGQLINRVYAGTYATVADAQAASNALRASYNLAGIVTTL